MFFYFTWMSFRDNVVYPFIIDCCGTALGYYLRNIPKHNYNYKQEKQPYIFHHTHWPATKEYNKCYSKQYNDVYGYMGNGDMYEINNIEF